MTWTTPKPEIDLDDDVPEKPSYMSAKAIEEYNSGKLDPANPYVWSSEPLAPGKFERPATGWQTLESGWQTLVEPEPWRPIVGGRVMVKSWYEFPGTITQVGPEQCEIRFDYELPWGKQVVIPNSWLAPVIKK